MLKRTVLASLFSVLCISCASTDYGVREVGEKPKDSSSTEASIWYQLEEQEKQIKRSGQLVTDENLNQMVREATCKIATKFCEGLRVYIVREPGFNALMFPNGMMIVRTGMLLRAENVDQLAFILSHEFVHYEENHTLEILASAKNANNMGLAIGAVLTGFTGVNPVVGQLLTYTDTFAYSREKETESDVKGMQYMREASYDPSASIIIWENHLKELEASDVKAKNKREKAKSGGVYDTHPAIRERIADLKEAYSGEINVQAGTAEYRAMVRPFLKEWLDDEVIRRDFGSTMHLIDRLGEVEGDSGVLNYARGRLFALRDEEGDEDSALSAYVTAVSHADVPGEAYRALGDHYRGKEQIQEAVSAYQSYLDAAPDSEDAALIEFQILKMQR